MGLFEMLKVAVDESFGTRGALRNCRDEIGRGQQHDEAVRRLCRRLPVRDDEPAAAATS